MYAWKPDAKTIQEANLTKWLRELNFKDLNTFYTWSCQNHDEFWQKVAETLPILFKTKATSICDLSKGIEQPNWFANARMNIIDSCLNTEKDHTAFLYQNVQKEVCSFSYGELSKLVNRISNSLSQDFKVGDAIAIIMPMNLLACATYLAIIQMGGVVVSIADSFSTNEIKTRLEIANTKAVFTQYEINWNNKKLPLYQKIKETNIEKIFVLPEYLDENDQRTYDAKTIKWQDFLSANSTFTSVACKPMAPINILFSSGTTGTPKAIPWNHTTPIKAASDAYFHQNIKPQDVLAWPTNLGWMMGPWLLFAGLINHATIALYTGSPKERSFLEFIAKAKVTMLGLVPTLVASFKQDNLLENIDFSHLKVFSSSGECSNEQDMTYLMQASGNKPIIEYCGGTEIGGAYISSTVIQENLPAQFSTPTMGTRFTILDGEVALIPPTLGLSTTLLNADHHHVYFADMPKTREGFVLRRHGDQIEQLPSGYYRILGRVDDTMNLGGIKVSAAEIERALIGIKNIFELAAITAPNHGGPDKLVIVAATPHLDLDREILKKEMQKLLSKNLNPLFHIEEVKLVPELPKTASNKIMRRVLREMI